jgi:plastocyanin
MGMKKIKAHLLVLIFILFMLTTSSTSLILTHAQDLFSLPSGAYAPNGQAYYNPPVLFQFDPQVVTASPGQTISFTVRYQTWSFREWPSTVIWQLLAIVSWTPSWPPPSGYYIPFYDGIPGWYPGISQTKSFTITVPSTPGTYYIWFCYDLHYSMGQAIADFKNPLPLPAHVKIIVQRPNQLPTAYIDSVSPNPAYKGQTVSFSGHGSDPDGTIVGYEWRSSIDGFLSSSASFSTSKLSVGTHTIYFKVKDNAGAWSPEVTVILRILDFDFTVAVSPYSRTVTIGTSTYYTVTTFLVSGSSRPVSLSLLGLPNNVGTYSFEKESGSPPFATKLKISIFPNAPAGIYNLRVVSTGGGLTKESLSFTLVVQAPLLDVSLTSDKRTYAKGENVQILITVKDEQSKLTDATVDCKVLTPSREEITVDISRLSFGIYQGKFTATGKEGDYTIIATAKKPGYASGSRELNFNVQGTYCIRDHRVYYDPFKRSILEVGGKVIKEGNYFNIDLSLKNRVGAWYWIKIYRSPQYFVPETLVYEAVIWPSQTLYPVRVKTPLLSEGYSQICIDVELSWTMEAFGLIINVLPIPIPNPLDYIADFVWLQSELTTHMILSKYLSSEFDSKPESYEKAVEFTNAFVKLCSNEPDYVGKKLLEFCERIKIQASKDAVMAAIKSFPWVSYIVKAILWNFHVWNTPATEIIYVDVEVCPS